MDWLPSWQMFQGALWQNAVVLAMTPWTTPTHFPNGEISFRLGSGWKSHSHVISPLKRSYGFSGQSRGRKADVQSYLAAQTILGFSKLTGKGWSASANVKVQIGFSECFCSQHKSKAPFHVNALSKSDTLKGHGCGVVLVSIYQSCKIGAFFPSPC